METANPPNDAHRDLLVCRYPDCKHEWYPRKPGDNPTYCAHCKRAGWQRGATSGAASRAPLSLPDANDFGYAFSARFARGELQGFSQDQLKVLFPHGAVGGPGGRSMPSAVAAEITMFEESLPNEGRAEFRGELRIWLAGYKATHVRATGKPPQGVKR